jgi:hypothetical protein
VGLNVVASNAATGEQHDDEWYEARERVAQKYMLGETQGNVAAVRQEGEAVMVRRVEVEGDGDATIQNVPANEFIAQERERVEATAPTAQPEVVSQSTSALDAGDQPANADDDSLPLTPNDSDADSDGEGTKRVAAQVKDFSVAREPVADEPSIVKDGAVITQPESDE